MRGVSILLLAASLSGTIAQDCAAQVKGRFLLEDASRTGRSQRIVDDATSRAMNLRLSLDPSGGSAYAASSPGPILVATPGMSEAVLQLNLSDPTWGPDNALALQLITPITKGERFTELADHDGLAGTSRAVLKWSKGIASPGTVEHYSNLAVTSGVYSWRTLAGGPKSESRELNVEGGLGVVLRRASWKDRLVRVGFVLQDVMKAAVSQSVCAQVAGQPAGVFNCEDQVVGAPGRVTSHLANFEFRMLVRETYTAGVVIARDLKEDVTAVRVPIWFLSDSSKALSGGVMLGYRTDGDRRPTLSIFIGQLDP